MTSGSPRLIVVGGGLAGCIAALAMSRERTDISLLLVEQGETFGGNHVWSFFDTDIDPRHRHLADMLVPYRWPAHEVRFPSRERTIAIGYNSVLSSRLDQIVRDQLRPSEYRLGQSVTEISPHHIVLENGERIEATAVIDARGPGPMPKLDLAWQKFVGRTYRTRQPHGRLRPVIMDATVPQVDGYRFIYWLPFSHTEVMVEDTYYSDTAELDKPLGSGLDGLMSDVLGGKDTPELVAEEKGVLPVVLGGEISALWPDNGPPIAQLGLRGGFFHPTTGYSLPDAIRNAALLISQQSFSSAALHHLFRDRAEKLWKERRFFRMINRMLFRAAEPQLRYRVLEHFYRLPQSLIGRFYAAELTRLDKLRILSGRPPVPIIRALGAMRERAS